MKVIELASDVKWSAANAQVDNQFASGEHAHELVAYVQKFWRKSDGSEPGCRIFVEERFVDELVRGFGWTLENDPLPLSKARVLIASGDAEWIKIHLDAVQP